jgi:tetratricopeptide (TPR) repeat protein
MPGPSDHHEGELLDALGSQYLDALELYRTNRLDRAEDALRGILRAEPRLAEPHLTLGRLLLDTARLEPAEDHTRTALEILGSDGQWTDEVPDHVVQSIAHAQLAEILRRRADDDDVIFGDPERFHAIVKESKEHFARAAELDPSDATSSFYAFFMGPPQEG